jgi:predicted nucleotidyltransferase
LQEQHIKWLRRASEQQKGLAEERLTRAWQVAHTAAQILRERYGVSRVRVFGSLLEPSRFHADSDVDLAVEGLASSDYWDALADILFLDDEITIDLIEASSCPPAIWATVERKGVDL